MKIPLTKGYFALVDPIDYPKLSKFKWGFLPIDTGNIVGYAVRQDTKRPNGKTVLMHREILGLEQNERTDHKNGYGLDNRRSNLRKCTPQQNSFNTNSHKDGSSKFKGVYWDCKRKLWAAQIRINRRNTYIGRFSSERKAHEAYQQIAKQYHGEFLKTPVKEDTEGEGK